MRAPAEVRLWGSRIGAVYLPAGNRTAIFEYEPDFTGSGIELSPLEMPLADRRYSFPALNPETFKGLPGLLADSLPDKYGNALIDAWLARDGRSPESFDAVERLCYVGSRGMGALEFVPTLGPEATGSQVIEIGRLVQLASDVLARREELVASLRKAEREDSMHEILSVGTSAGGARAKAVIAWNPTTDQIRSGQIDVGAGFEYWLLKFDGVENNKDKERLADPAGYGAIEFAYSKMATDAGIEMTECRLLEEGGRRHFMTRRFDRTPSGGKLHMQTLCGLAHFDYMLAGAYSYEQLFMVMRRLGLPHAEIEQQYRRMVFNVIARNQDDHVKNIAFLMNRAGEWSLAPAYDMTYAYSSRGTWTSTHQMSLNGKRDDFTLIDLQAAGRSALLKRGRAKQIVDEVVAVVARWPEYAAAAGVTERHAEQVQAALRLDLPRA